MGAMYQFIILICYFCKIRVFVTFSFTPRYRKLSRPTANFYKLSTDQSPS
jgi:hypothetical protein